MSRMGEYPRIGAADAPAGTVVPVTVPAGGGGPPAVREVLLSELAGGTAPELAGEVDALTARVDVLEAGANLTLPAPVAVATPAAVLNDYAPTLTPNQTAIVAPAVPTTITGLGLPAATTRGHVANLGTADLTLAHRHAGSTAGNRFYTTTRADLVLPPGARAEFERVPVGGVNHYSVWGV